MRILAQDRLHALANGQTLAEHAVGTVLFADISGFTSLTEALNVALGSRRGPEALSQQINQIYTALVREVERWQGSVIGFAGDALTCWFNDRSGDFDVPPPVAWLKEQEQVAGSFTPIFVIVPHRFAWLSWYDVSDFTDQLVG